MKAEKGAVLDVGVQFALLGRICWWHRITMGIHDSCPPTT